MTVPAKGWSAAKRAMRHLKALGIPMPPKPAFDAERLQLPPKLDTLTTGKVTQEMNRWSQMLAYVKAQLSLADISYKQSTVKMEHAHAIEFLRLRELNPQSTVTELKLQITASVRFQKLQKRIDVAEAKKRLLEAVHEGYDQNYRLLSRELTRRTNAVDRNLDP